MNEQNIQYQLERYSIDVIIDIEKYISNDFNRVSGTTNSGYVRECLQILARECREHAFNLTIASSWIQKEPIDPIIYIRYPVNVMKKYTECLRSNSELIRYLSFYSEIIRQLNETYMDLSKKTENINASIIFKKLAFEKKIQEGILVALVIKFEIT